MHNLAILHLNGLGVPKDEAAARQWFESAAKKGHPNAMFELASMLHSGRGGPKDDEEAKLWLHLVTRLGGDASLREKAQRLLQQVSGGRGGP